ncbi:pleckstrin homology domain-containing family G member 4B [Rhynchocyon petersi]
MEHVTVPEAMCGQVFTGEFLQGAGAQQGSHPLQSCLLTSSAAVHCAWSSVTDPPSGLQGHHHAENPQLCSSWEASVMLGPHFQQGVLTLQPHSGCPGGGPMTPRDGLDGGLEGPEVGLGSLDRGSPEACPDKPRPGPGVRWFRKSYVEALRNPVPLGSSSEESLLDKAGDTTAGQGIRPRATASPVLKGLTGPVHPWESRQPTDRVKTVPRRSRSWDRVPRSPLSSEPEAQQKSRGEAGIQLRGVPRRPTAGAGAGSPGAIVGSSQSPQEVDDTQTSGSICEDSASSQGQMTDTSDQMPNLQCPQDPELRAPSWVLGVSLGLLHSGAVTLPGTRDRGGRAVVQVSVGGPLWAQKHTSSAELTCLLRYLHSIPRKEVRDLGLVILVDTRKDPVTPVLSRALEVLQSTVPSIIHSILLLVDKESAVKPDKDAALQCEVVSSLKALHKYIDSSQLTPELDGSFLYSHSDWICFRRKLEFFTANCEQAISFLQTSVCSLNTHRTLSTEQGIKELIRMHRAVMECVLEDALLVTLRLEGGVILARLRRDELGTTEDGRDAMEVATRLYDQVDEAVHLLVLSSNTCLAWLEGLQERRCAHGLTQEEPDPALLSVCTLLGGPSTMCLGLSPLRLEPQVRQCFQQEQEPPHGPVGLPKPKNKEAKQEGSPDPQKAAAMAPGWRLSHQEHRKYLVPEVPSSPLDAEHLRSGCQVVTTGEQGSGSGCELQLYQAVWSEGQQTSCHMEGLLPAATPVHSLPPFCRGAHPHGQYTTSAQEDTDLDAGVPALWDVLTMPGGPHDNSSSRCPEPAWAPGPHLRKHPLKKMMRKTQCFEEPPPNGGPRELRQLGHTGVHIRGLEVTSTVATEISLLPRNRSLSSPPRVHHPEMDRRPHTGSLMHYIMAEMVSTEREYVRSLGYVIDNYFPEMERMDLPQELRGKRSTVFGNLEKLHDFHSRYFLRELERCWHCPLAVGRSFLKHEEQFSMYALYSKNKPRSDALLSSRGNAFFKTKQQALGDKMDLASYLLKPVQRMGKYALLLKELVKEAGRSPTWELELGQLRAAEDMVRFQLRHGNDLLAMDAVRGCDVNLKEQGPLRCQDKFIVCCGRRKSLRQVFLFEDLILFSKTKKMGDGYDIYVYKQSFKTAEIGMTENVGDSGLHFEIWFRRRRRPQDTYILQASSVEVKASWTCIIGRILWRQALRNRELRMQEMVSMGIGSKPFMDIKPSDAAISDRAIEYIMKGTESRSRASIAVSSFDHATAFKRPHSTLSDSSSSSSSSQSSSILGSLNLHVYSSPPGQPALCPWSYNIRVCIEEDEREQEEMGSQPSMTTESSGSSQCTSGDSTGSPRGPHPGLSQLDDDDGEATPGSSPTLPSRTPWRQHGRQFTTSHKGPGEGSCWKALGQRFHVPLGNVRPQALRALQAILEVMGLVVGRAVKEDLVVPAGGGPTVMWRQPVWALHGQKGQPTKVARLCWAGVTPPMDSCHRTSSGLLP